MERGHGKDRRRVAYKEEEQMKVKVKRERQSDERKCCKHWKDRKKLKGQLKEQTKTRSEEELKQFRWYLLTSRTGSLSPSSLWPHRWQTGSEGRWPPASSHPQTTDCSDPPPSPAHGKKHIQNVFLCDPVTSPCSPFKRSRKIIL